MVVFYTSVATNHALTSFHVVGIHFTLDPSSVYHALTPPFLFHSPLVLPLVLMTAVDILWW